MYCDNNTLESHRITLSWSTSTVELQCMTVLSVFHSYFAHFTHKPKYKFKTSLTSLARTIFIEIHHTFIYIECRVRIVSCRNVKSVYYEWVLHTSNRFQAWVDDLVEDEVVELKCEIKKNDLSLRLSRTFVLGFPTSYSLRSCIWAGWLPEVFNTRCLGFFIVDSVKMIINFVRHLNWVLPMKQR